MLKKILFPVDVEELQFAREALEYVVKLARVDGASVHVVSVLPGFTMPMVASYFPKDAFDKARKALEKTLRDFVAREFPEDLEVTCAIREGTPWKEIIRERMDSGCDLIVIGAHNRKRISDVMLGSVANKVVENARVSVMVVKPRI
ncbi:universal stress protein [Hahella sp. SMD15-11]|uniref:Universal stress protein n=1 Tax=Thermohahella caldifontis TaxID=3142973 RepID=A0AB39UU94_9GAMM